MAGMTFYDNTKTAPRFVAEWIGADNLVRGGAKLNASAFMSFTVKVNQANVAEGDVSITVDALPVAIPAGTILDFGLHSTGDIAMIAKVTTNAAKGATSLAVAALAHAIENDAEATYTITTSTVPAGTVVGQTFAERANGDFLEQAAAGDDIVYIVAFDVTDLNVNNDVELLKPNTQIYEDLMTGFSDLAAAVQALVRANYVTLVSSGV